MMAEAAPITPKNGAYIGASSIDVLIVAGFVTAQRSGRSRVYLQVADRRAERRTYERSSRSLTSLN